MLGYSGIVGGGSQESTEVQSVLGAVSAVRLVAVELSWELWSNWLKWHWGQEVEFEWLQ